MTEAFPYLPSLVGQDASLVFGKGSGIDSVADGLERLDRTATPEEQMAILDRTRRRPGTRRRPVSPSPTRSRHLAPSLPIVRGSYSEPTALMQSMTAWAS